MTKFSPIADTALAVHRENLGRIHPDVLAASAEELLECGWGDTPRHAIPANWREVQGGDAGAVPANAKKCGGCLKALPLSSFCKNRKKADGLDIYCRNCRSESWRIFKAKSGITGRTRRRASV